MSDSMTVEQRLAQVEREIADLKSRVNSLGGQKPNWIDTVSGSFKDDPDFEEIVRLGKEIREADRPE